MSETFIIDFVHYRFNKDILEPRNFVEDIEILKFKEFLLSTVNRH